MLQAYGIRKNIPQIEEICKNISRAQTQQNRPKQKKTKTKMTKSPFLRKSEVTNSHLYHMRQVVKGHEESDREIAEHYLATDKRIAELAKIIAEHPGRTDKAHTEETPFVLSDYRRIKEESRQLQKIELVAGYRERSNAAEKLYNMWLSITKEKVAQSAPYNDERKQEQEGHVFYNRNMEPFDITTRKWHKGRKGEALIKIGFQTYIKHTNLYKQGWCAHGNPLDSLGYVSTKAWGPDIIVTYKNKTVMVAELKTIKPDYNNHLSIRTHTIIEDVIPRFKNHKHAQTKLVIFVLPNQQTTLSIPIEAKQQLDQNEIQTILISNKEELYTLIQTITKITEQLRIRLPEKSCPKAVAGVKVECVHNKCVQTVEKIGYRGGLWLVCARLF